ncbi:hypothetical protein TRIATDRAFT_323182 [Trichoderma atroviride IMI 206040]|uniref:Uncharacterized protein n=1 Tax=Hypocrea atroviridis (strain ATCC 20476 / IMI 206040) TaxID=452589 RepID=G9PB92_HYPAI|nr:uncharacterized protein TRIATDRAFT_323182 [Trichoderma atroviride IMI 206040]EHK39641.1 hypothetical protein TRIATDRAFT_323182 [Trichoderma atroviride IMI 206040]
MQGGTDDWANLYHLSPSSIWSRTTLIIEATAQFGVARGAIGPQRPSPKAPFLDPQPLLELQTQFEALPSRAESWELGRSGEAMRACTNILWVAYP